VARKPTNGAGSHEPRPPGGFGPRQLDRPVFAQPEPTADPTTFLVKHPSDGVAYKAIDELNREHKLHPLPFPAPRGGTEPRLDLARVLGGDDLAQLAAARVRQNGQIVFHAGGDCGNTTSPKHQNEVVDKLLGDFHEHSRRELPAFALLLGDIVYSFGEAKFYYDQFYEPYRDYAAPILAVAGNHDGMVSPEAHAKSLDAYLRNFCADHYVVTPDALTLSRTAQVQPGVFFTFEAPYLRILAFYSNALEDPGVIADDGEHVGRAQLDFMEAALRRYLADGHGEALIFAHHHPPYTASHGGSRHGGSPKMLAMMDEVCARVGVWPHAVLAGHAHNMQRFTRFRPDGTQIPYVTCGNMGHNVQRLSRNGAATIRVPNVLERAGPGEDQIVFERYDDLNYGYLRVIATAAQLRIEYHAASDGPHVKSPDDSVTVDLATRKITKFEAPDFGHSEQADDVRTLRETHLSEGRRHRASVHD
jgi:hypothetical protein